MDVNDQIPPFFRLLIIDDKIAGSREHREYFHNIFTAIILEEAVNKNVCLDSISIAFEGNPATGFKKWQDEPFNLTLIDVDFTDNREAAAQADDLTRYILNSGDQGVQIFNLLKTQTGESGPFSFRKGKNEFFLWTCLFKILKSAPEEKEKFINQHSLQEDKRLLEKDEKSLGEIHEKIKEHIGFIAKNSYTQEQQAERLLYALQRDYGDARKNFADGYIVAARENTYQWMPSLVENSTGADGATLRLCGYRLPQSLINTTKGKFFPLRCSTVFKAVDVLAYLLHDKPNNIITEYCTSLKARLGDQEKRSFIPWYPAPDEKEKHKENQGYIAAATPLTGISLIGSENAIVALSEKVRALLNGPFDKIVLKTTYLDSKKQWDNTEWPSVHIQSHMRSRCLYPDTGTPTLWNSGKTAMETLPPKQMCKLLKLLQVEGITSDQVVVSLGSKFRATDREMAEVIWELLFDEVFQDIDKSEFRFVEINVRHFLREIASHHLGGDEYLTPTVLNQKASSNWKAYWQEFDQWLSMIHKVAVQHKKKLILKLPYRSDVLAHVERILPLASSKDTDFGVCGITVVNALKIPVPKTKRPASAFSRDWYADPDGWGDAQGKLYQMSGQLLGTYRNQILGLLANNNDPLRESGMDIWVSGGLTGRNEVTHCQGLEGQRELITGIQIGTWALLDTDIKNDGESNWVNRQRPVRPAEQNGQFELNVQGCKKACCNNTNILCPHGTLATKQQGLMVEIVEPTKCVNCTSWNCIKNCKTGRLKKVLKSNAIADHNSKDRQKKSEAFEPRFIFPNSNKCSACGRCSRSFYCDSFIDRQNTNLPPLMDSRYCSGCGLCVQICSSGALQLYSPKNFIILLSSSHERKRILEVLGIPHIQYHPVEDLNNLALRRFKWI